MALFRNTIPLRIVLCAKKTGLGFLLSVLLVRGGEGKEKKGGEAKHCKL